MNEKLRNLIWFELSQSKAWELYLSEYATNRIDRRKIWNGVVLCLSLVGASSFAGWGVFPGLSAYVPAAACAVTAVVQIAAILKDNMIVDNAEIDNICRLRSLYIRYYNGMEMLWTLYDGGMKTEAEALGEYLNLRNSTTEMEELKDRISVATIEAAMRKVEADTDYILEKRFC